MAIVVSHIRDVPTNAVRYALQPDGTVLVYLPGDGLPASPTEIAVPHNRLAQPDIFAWRASPGTIALTSTAGSAAAPIPVCLGASSGQLWAAWNQDLYFSGNDGVTWTKIFTFPTSGRIMAARMLDSGEMIVTTNSENATPNTSHLYKSIGGPLANVWSNKLQSPNNGAVFFDRCVAVSGDLVFVAEYGGRGLAQRAYLSTDEAETFTPVFAVADYPDECPDPANAHIHGVCIDIEGGALYLATGDQQNKGMWRAELSSPTKWVRIYREQPTTIIATKAGILWGTDNVPHGVLLTRRDKLNDPELAWSAPEGVVGSTAYCRGRPGDPILFGFGPLSEGVRGYVAATLDGENFQTLYTGSVGSGVLRVFGPSDSGMYFGNISEGGVSDWRGWVAKAPTWSIGGEADRRDVRRRWLPAAGASSVSGAPSFGVANNRVPVWLMDGGGNEAVGWYYDVPDEWSAWLAELYWINTTATPGSIAVQVTSNDLYGHGVSFTSWEVSEPVTTITASASATLLNIHTVAQSRPVRSGHGAIRVQRRPTETGDTIAADIGIVGVMLRRVT